ncbi:hypothetical protein [Rhizobacter fulvus]
MNLIEKSLCSLTILLLVCSPSANAYVKLPVEMRPPIDESLESRFRDLPRAADYAWESESECKEVIGNRWRDAEREYTVKQRDVDAAVRGCTFEVVNDNARMAYVAAQSKRDDFKSCLARNKINREGVVIGMTAGDVMLCGWGKPMSVAATGIKTEKWTYQVVGYERSQEGRLTPVRRTHFLNVTEGRVVSMPDGEIVRAWK